MTSGSHRIIIGRRTWLSAQTARLGARAIVADMHAEHSLNVVGRCERTRLKAGFTPPTVRWIPADL
jgi:hypothetical protein